MDNNQLADLIEECQTIRENLVETLKLVDEQIASARHNTQLFRTWGMWTALMDTVYQRSRKATAAATEAQQMILLWKELESHRQAVLPIRKIA